MRTPDEVKRGLELHANVDESCYGKGCPFAGGEDGAYCIDVLARDALALIQQLEAKLAEYEKPLVPLKESEIYNDAVWLEMNAVNDEPRVVDIAPAFSDPGNKAEITLLGVTRRAYLPYAHYGSSWRCWSRKPTDEERKAAKWDETT